VNRREFDQWLKGDVVSVLASEALTAQGELESAELELEQAEKEHSVAQQVDGRSEADAKDLESGESQALLDRARQRVDRLREKRDQLKTKADKAADDNSALNQKWQQLWSDEIALLIRTSDQKAVSFKSWRELTGRVNPLPTLVPWLDGCMRQTRRLFALVAREPMVEERTFSDYRLSLEQRVEGLQSEVSSVLKGISLANGFLMQVKRGIPNGRVAPGIDALLKVLAQVEVQAKALQESVGAPTFKSELADGLRPLWRYVDNRFGTWQRRVKPPVVELLWSLLIVALFYIIVGAFLPTIWILLPLISIALWRTLSKYWNTRFVLDQAIRKARNKLAPLRADGDDPTGASVWTLKADHERPAFVSIVRVQVASLSSDLPKDKTGEEADTDKSKWRHATEALGKIGAVILALLVTGLVMTLLVVGLKVTPRYAVIGASSGQAECTLTVGSIVWPGPGQLLLLEGGWLGHFNVVSQSRISRIAPEGSAPERCRSAPNASLELHSTIVDYPNLVERNRVLAVPIFPNPVHCPAPLNTGISDQGKEMIKRLGRAIISCSAPLHAVRVDVRGFASSKEFAHCKPTNDLNLELAEKRRTDVIRELRKAVQDAPEDLEIEYGDLGPRWRDSDEMHQNAFISDQENGELKKDRERLTRYVEVEIRDAASCERPLVQMQR
jgi:hypothetical protein